MSHSEFIKKYEEFQLLHFTPQTFLINLLQLIHGYLFSGDTELRYQPESLEYQRIQVELQRLYMLTKENIDLDDYIKWVCQSVTVIHMYQPFFDGNTRTCLILQKLVFAMKGITLHLPEKVEIGRQLIGILYHEDEEIGESTFQFVKKHITKNIE